VLDRHEAVIDGAVPVLVGTVIVVGEVLHGGHSTGPAPVALGLAAAAVLWARHRWPVFTLVASGVLVGALFHVDASAGAVAVLAPAVALYSVALRRGRSTQLLAGLAAVGAVLLADLLHSGRPGVLQTLGHALLIAIPLLAAEQVRGHRSYLSLLTERLELSEQAHEREAELRAEQERMQIARELHDVVAHTLTEINIEAAAAAERTSNDPAHTALERIEHTSHRAIGELRAILGVLRDRDEQSEPARIPAPGVRDIAALIDRMQTTGLQAQLRISGEPPDRLSDGSSLAAYRIVQESITNARRHAAGAPVCVSLDFNATKLSLAIENATGVDSNGSRDTSGVGIAGMRERARALGGSFEAGPTPGGFRVKADLPYEPSG
jgi:signal transduction histidine kinase